MKRRTIVQTSLAAGLMAGMVALGLSEGRPTIARQGRAMAADRLAVPARRVAARPSLAPRRARSLCTAQDRLLRQLRDRRRHRRGGRPRHRRRLAGRALRAGQGRAGRPYRRLVRSRATLSLPADRRRDAPCRRHCRFAKMRPRHCRDRRQPRRRARTHQRPIGISSRAWCRTGSARNSAAVKHFMLFRTARFQPAHDHEPAEARGRKTKSRDD